MIRSERKSKPSDPPTVDMLRTGSRDLPVPSHLGATGREVFAAAIRDLEGMGLIDRADLRAVEAFASAYEEWREYRRRLEQHGPSYSVFTASGEARVLPRPEVALAQEAWRRFTSLLPELYLTPLARVRSAPKSRAVKPPVNPLADFLGMPGSERPGGS